MATVEDDVVSRARLEDGAEQAVNFAVTVNHPDFAQTRSQTDILIFMSYRQCRILCTWILPEHLHNTNLLYPYTTDMHYMHMCFHYCKVLPSLITTSANKQ